MPSPNSMKSRAVLHRAIQDRKVMVESSDKMWSTGEGNDKLPLYSCLENPMNSMKRQKDRTLKNELLRLVGAQYATGDQWRNNFRKNEEMEPKQKQHPFMDLTFQVPMQYCFCSIGLYFHHLSHPQLRVVFALAPSLHSSWSYFCTDLQ